MACAEPVIISVHKCLAISIGNQVFSITEFLTVLLEVADLLNERPIGRNPTHHDDDFHLFFKQFIVKENF